MIQIERRASAVLYKFLVSNCSDYHFLIPANVCSVVPLTFLASGVGFSFVDIDDSTHAGSFDEYKKAVRECPDCKVGVLFVNAYGTRNDTKQFYEDIRTLRNDMIIIEDDCLCVPVTRRTNPVENVDLEFYSTGNSKYVQMPMEGGYGMIRDGFAYNQIEAPFNENGYDEQLKKIRACRRNRKQFQYEENNWLPLASFISNKLSADDYFREIERRIVISRNHKQIIDSIYDEILPNELRLGEAYNTWRYTLALPSHDMRETVMDALGAENLYASSHYQSAAYLYKHIHCRNTECEADRILNLFNEEKYSVEMAQRTAEIINEIYKQYDK